MVVDELARAAGERFRKARFVPVEAAELTIEADYVLELFAKREEADALLIDEGADAVRTLIASGLEAAQDRHHRPGLPT